MTAVVSFASCSVRMVLQVHDDTSAGESQRFVHGCFCPGICATPESLRIGVVNVKTLLGSMPDFAAALNAVSNCSGDARIIFASESASW